MVGIPLGLSSKKSGKSGGFVLTIALVFVYYFVSLRGCVAGAAGEGRSDARAWLANIAFFAAGAILLWQAERRPLHFQPSDWGESATLMPPGQVPTFRLGRRDSANAFERCFHAPPRIQRQFSYPARRLRACAISLSIWG